MGAMALWARTEFMKHIFDHDESANKPAGQYLALYVGDPSGAGTEVSVANNYIRKSISFGVASARRTTQDAVVNFNQASGDWGTITHWAVFDAEASGNMLAHGAFSSSFHPVNGSTPSVASGQVYVEFSAGGGSGGAGYTTYVANKWLDWCFNSVTFTKPTTYLCLTPATLGDATGAPTDITGTSYARKVVNVHDGAAGKWSAVTDATATNNDTITFASPGADDWQTFVAVGVVDSATANAGNLIAYDNLVTDQAAKTGDTIQFQAGAFDLALT